MGCTDNPEEKNEVREIEPALMQAINSSANNPRRFEPFLQSNQDPNFNFKEVEEDIYVGKGLKKMKAYISPISKEDLDKKRIGFWGTRTEGNEQTWEFLKQVCEMTSEEEALTYMAETAKNDTTIAPDIPVFTGSNTNVNITDLKIRMTSDYIVFFRTIYIGMLPIVQGFVVDKSIYLNYMTQEEQLAYAKLPYAIELVYEDTILLTIGKNSAEYELRTKRPLPPPYDKIVFKMYSSEISGSADLTILFSGLILLIVVAVCLITIYRFTQSKVALAAKRQDFVSAITHELKTPLTAIKMYAELLQNSWVASEEKKQRYYGQIASEADRLSRLIQNVLNLSKLDGNRWNVQLRKERPKAVLDDFIATYSKNIEKQGFELTVSTDTDADNVALLIDRDAVMQILMNLVDNSLKFSKNASYKMISIELRVNNGDMYLAVRDYGPGIPASEMKKVFQEFYRVENEMTRSTSGTGIGLSMVKKLCTLTNMKIEIENAGPGLRTKIHFPPLDI